jgi:parvulin-like peptidyl-prolyl isomerase
MRKFGAFAVAACFLATAAEVAGQGGAPPGSAGQTPPPVLQGLPSPPPSNIIQRIIVKVNGEIFTLTELVQRQADAVRQDNPDLANNAQLSAKIAEITPQLLVEVVDELLMVQRGRELGIRFSDENFKNALENVKKQNNLDDEGLKKALVQAGLTLAELRQNFERTYLMNGVTQTEIMANMRLTEEEARQYYEKHPEAFMKPATMVLREIVVNVSTRTDALGQPATNVAEDEAAKEKITKARARVLSGEDFAKVAGEVSDAGSKANGGLVGTVVIDEMVSSLRDTLSKLKQGDVTEPLRFPAGYRIYQVESRTVAQVQPFEEVRDAIAQKIYQERAAVETKKYLDKMRAQALIEWKDEGYRKMYEKALLSQGK